MNPSFTNESFAIRLSEPRPTATVFDFVNVVFVYAVFRCYLSGYSWVSENLKHLRFGEFGVNVHGSSDNRSIRDHVSRVSELSVKPQMMWVYTKTIVANVWGMTALQFRSVIAQVKNKSNAMCASLFAEIRHQAIPCRSACLERPANAIALFRAGGHFIFQPFKRLAGFGLCKFRWTAVGRTAILASPALSSMLRCWSIAGLANTYSFIHGVTPLVRMLRFRKPRQVQLRSAFAL